MSRYGNQRHDHIKAELKLRGISFSEIARQLGVTCASVTMVSQGRSMSRRIQNAIASRLGMPTEVLFPETGGAPKRKI